MRTCVLRTTINIIVYHGDTSTMQLSGIITLTTDFGLADSYVGVMKGVILGIAPSARLIDTTHDIQPQHIHQAAYIVDTFFRYFPAGTIHVVVVDPGVGTARRSVILQTPEALFVAPDNGVLTYVWRDALARWGAQSCTIVSLTQPEFWLSPISNTFHGRDIFAPVAAHLMRGIAIERCGDLLRELTNTELDEPTYGRRGELVGQIIHVDHFGNCITNIEPPQLEQIGPTEQLTFQVIDQRIAGLQRSYGDLPAGSLIALLGSSRRVELAVCNGNAAKTLGVGISDRVKVFGPQ
jgi:S-adenosylmethionine hydrolase